MRHIICSLVLAFLIHSPSAFAADPAGWELVWSDEFDGAAVDLTKWEFEVNARGGGNNELQYYLTNNVRVRDGLLVLEARQERYSGPEGTRDYTSSRLHAPAPGGLALRSI